MARLREQLAEARARVSLQRAGVEQLRKERDRGAPEVELVRVQVVEPEMLATMRAGGATASGAPLPVLLLAGRVRSPVGLKSLTINSREESLDEQGLFRTRLLIRDAGDSLVRIVAVDRNDQQAALEVSPPRRSGMPVAPGAAPGPESIPRLRASLGKYHALVIGNDRYASFRPLRTAANDARAVAAVLRKRYGFEVTLLENATRGQTLAELNSLRQRLTDKDNLLIYYAGHGDLDEQNQRGHWLPVDAQPGAPATWLSNTDLSDVLNAMAVRHLLVVADSCYAATLTQSSTGRPEPGSGTSERVKTVEGLASRRARMVMTSGGIEPVADMPGAPTPRSPRSSSTPSRPTRAPCSAETSSAACRFACTTSPSAGRSPRCRSTPPSSTRATRAGTSSSCAGGPDQPSSGVDGARAPWRDGGCGEPGAGVC